MSNEQKLVEVFPDITEEFLRGVCDAYKSENPSLDELVDLVLSFEFPPLKEVTSPSDTSNTTESSPAITQTELKTDDALPVVEAVDPSLPVGEAVALALPVGEAVALALPVGEPVAPSLPVVEAVQITNDIDVRESSVLLTSSNHDEKLIEINNVRETTVENENGEKCDSLIIDLSEVQEPTPTSCTAEMESCTSSDLIGSYEYLSTASLVSETDNRDADRVDECQDEFEANKTNRDPLEAHLVEDETCVESKSDDEKINHNYELVQILMTENNNEEVKKGEFKINSNENGLAEEKNEFVTVFSTDSCLSETIPVVEQAELITEEAGDISTAKPCGNNDCSIVAASGNKSNSTNETLSKTKASKNTSRVDLPEEISKTLENITNIAQSKCALASKSDTLSASKNELLRRLSSASSGDGFSPSQNSPRRVSFRSSKGKSEEQRLRAKLIRQHRLSLENKTKKEQNNKSQFVDADSKYSLLTKILPDADPSYLSATSQRLATPEDLLQFISVSLDKRNYPKIIEEKKDESKVMDSFECTVEEFLQGVPDPLAEFLSDYYIRTGYEENAEIYLQSRYAGMDEDLIKERLAESRYNLTKVCAQLDSEGFLPGVYRLHSVALHHPPSVFFHQEVWFIEHRNEILSFLENAVEAAKIEEELNRPPTPPVVEEVFECEICADEIVEYSQLGTCDGPSGHLFCKNCIRRSTEVLLGDGATSFPCLTNCGGLIPLQTIQEVLPAQTFTILMGKIQEEEVRAANIAGVECCPFCPYAYGPGGEEVFTCQNPACSQLSCRTCRKKDHRPEICDMFKEEDLETARHFVEEKMTEALVRVCSNCGIKIVKENGCNKMTCSKCGVKMCYVCRQPNVEYNHFNGQGGSNYDRCELFTDDATVHTQPVAESARQAVDQLIANNPNINLDASMIIP